MKKLLLIVSMLWCIGNAWAQDDMGWVKATNCGAYYHTGIDAVFTWTGGANNGYCNGYGTIQWYDVDGNKEGKYVGNVRNGINEGYGTQYYTNGNISYAGNWRNDMENGQGTKYNYDGSVAYSGKFVNGDLEGIASMNYAASVVGRFVMDKIFDGGINLRTGIVKIANNEVQIRITFNGNIMQSNYYAMTLIIKDTAPFVDFINYNDNTDFYLKLKLTATVMQGIHDIFESNSSDNN